MAVEARGEGWQVPDDRLYHWEHLWVKREGGEAVVGVTEYVARTAGAVLYVTLPAAGEEVPAGGELCALEAAKWVGHFPAPVAGRVAAVNGLVAERPGLINADPYGQGWLVRLAPAPGAAVAPPWAEAGLLTAAEYLEHIAQLEDEEGGAR